MELQEGIGPAMNIRQTTRVAKKKRQVERCVRYDRGGIIKLKENNTIYRATWRNTTNSHTGDPG